MRAGGNKAWLEGSFLGTTKNWEQRSTGKDYRGEPVLTQLQGQIG